MDEQPLLPELSADRIRAADHAALAEAFSVHRDRLARIVRFRLDLRLAARLSVDDVLQESYLSAAQRCTHLEGDSQAEIFVWLRLIVLQTLVDLHRRHMGAAMRDVRQEVQLAPAVGSGETAHFLAGALAASMTSPTEVIRRDERAAKLRASMGSLSETDQEILLLRHFEELDNAEVAAVLSIDPKAASIRYFRALRRLKNILEQHGVDSTLVFGLGV